MNKKVCVVGLGYIGLPTAAIFAKHGFDVLGVDINQRNIDLLNEGKIHIEENGLEEIVKQVVENGKLKGSLEPSEADIYIIAVPTPHKENYTADLDYVISATKSILPYIKEEDVIIVESTIPPRTIDDVVAPILKEVGWKVGEDIYLAHCPERVLPGQILVELVENNRIVGGINNISAEKAADIYRTFVKGQVIITTALTAEMSKLMENTYRDVNIALANELAKISEKIGVNALDVIELANLHPRVNIHFPGPGVGGHCLAVDPYFIIEKAPEQAKLIAHARTINNSMPDFVVKQVSFLLENNDSKIAILGLTYKGNIDDVRESPAMEVVNLLQEKGYKLAIHDPFVKEEQVEFPLSSFDEAIKDAECILILSDHMQFKNLDEKIIINTTKYPTIFDTRNCVDVKSNEISYYNFNNLHEIKQLKIKVAHI
jgi:UDP-N-acetyl-D-mannosaminuronic acid dehydrogenase